MISRFETISEYIVELNRYLQKIKEAEEKPQKENMKWRL